MFQNAIGINKVVILLRKYDNVTIDVHRENHFSGLSKMLQKNNRSSVGPQNIKRLQTIFFCI